MIAYAILLLFYVPVSIVGFYVFGGDVQSNVLSNLCSDFYRYTVEILITGHLAMAFTIVLNPIFQGCEDLTRIPKHFCWQRMVLRSFIVLFLALMAETIPSFGAILSFIGSSTVSILGFILPVIRDDPRPIHTTSERTISHHRLPVSVSPSSNTHLSCLSRVIPRWEIVLLFLSLLVGLYGALASSYSSFSDLVKPSSYVKPCWLDMYSADPSGKGNSTHC
jgi:solute carrier family 32 (vesicular inhibitory amino acid transporter)